jgi:hypothetical protein
MTLSVLDHHAPAVRTGGGRRAPKCQSSDGSARRGWWRCSYDDDGHNATFWSGPPGVTDGRDHNAVACRQFVITVIEAELDGALDDEIEVNRVSLVEGGPFALRIPAGDKPMRSVGPHAKVQQFRLPARARRLLSGQPVQGPEANFLAAAPPWLPWLRLLRHVDQARAALFIRPRDQTAHWLPHPFSCQPDFEAGVLRWPP